MTPPRALPTTSGSVPAHRPEYGDTPGWAIPTCDPRGTTMDSDHLGSVQGWRLDRAIDDQCDDVRLSVYREAGDGLALYITPVEYPADRFRVFLEPRAMLSLAWALIVGAVKWRKSRPWDADMTPAERAESEAWGNAF